MALAYLKDFQEELRRLGDQAFLRRFRVPVLVVVARTAELVDDDVPAREKTMVASPSERLAEGLVLIHRVFQLVKGAFAPAGPIVVGRSSECDVPINEYSISKRHCMFENRTEGFTIADCNSTNGTLVDGARLEAGQRLVLRGGETIALGRYAFIFQPASGFLEFLKQHQPGAAPRA